LRGLAAVGLTGYIGMNISVRANVRTAQAATRPERRAHRGVPWRRDHRHAVVGLGLIGLPATTCCCGSSPRRCRRRAARPRRLAFGGSLISIFARLGVHLHQGATSARTWWQVKRDPEDDPRNPAVIADNVGDNVGDCAGMAADLFETYAVTLVAPCCSADCCLPIGVQTSRSPPHLSLALGAASIVGSILGTSSFPRAPAARS